MSNVRDPGIMRVLAFLFPGLGHIYAGFMGAGIFLALIYMSGVILLILDLIPWLFLYSAIGAPTNQTPLYLLFGSIMVFMSWLLSVATLPKQESENDSINA